MPRINPALASTVAPPIPEVSTWARDYGGALGPLIDLSQAVPARPPPDALTRALVTAVATPEAARYGDDQGDAALREVLAAHMNEMYGSRCVGPAHLLITSGCNQAFFEVAIALAGAGESVALPEPYYFNHRMTLDMLGITARPLECPASTGFVPALDDIERELEAGARAIALVTPNNPTGAIYPTDLLAEVLRRCQHHGAALILDETYRDFLPEGQARPHGLLENASWPEGLIQLYSFSKAYCMPGYRLGAVAGSPAFLKELLKVQDSMQICAPRAGQIALAGVIDVLADFRAEQRQLVNHRANRCLEVVSSIPDWHLDSIGGFFAFVRREGAESSTALARRVVREAGVLCLPADCFGSASSPYLRFAFANVGDDEIDQLATRLGRL